MQLEEITIRGYKSIELLERFKLRNLNILIGANGAGKSNFISLFRLLAALANRNLQLYVQEEGGPDALLYRGRKHTTELEAEFYFGRKSYRMTLIPTANHRLIFKREENWYQGDEREMFESLGQAHEESLLHTSTGGSPINPADKSWRVYHFHDTSASAKVKGLHFSNDDWLLKPDGANLAAYVARLKHEYPQAYRRIVETIRLAAPFFGDFVVRDPLPSQIELEWTEKRDPDTPYRAHMLSDGTLRFICLTTLLLQPTKLLPDTIIIDEPELGLHPYAINLLAEMLKEAAEATQVIVSTQSVELLNQFEPEDVVVVQRVNGASHFERLSEEALASWLEDYSLGELWQRNILGGRPTP